MSILEDKDKLTWFVNDGHGHIMYSGISEEKAREIANCYPDWCIGWESNPVLWGKAQTVKVTLDKEKGAGCKIVGLKA